MIINRPTAGDPKLAGWQDEQRDRLRRQARDKSDLDEMFAAAERDGQRLMDRAAEIDRLRKARSV